ncbi:hypothetical protein DPMN_043920 [Dreissena polymorpha]|uniref:Uncharacterized protein n=1 Tax=Dreissena polymorpha TaxID=45954 RepID=A0A9D4D396_DREPO|nr:hypothetical protein DPMN_043920 [Dreissena polymorpha]
MFNKNISAATAADHMILISLSRQGLECMFICDKYSKQWQFEYNSDKSGVNSLWSCREIMRFMGTNQLIEVKVFNRPGLICDESLSTAKPFKDTSNKLR